MRDPSADSLEEQYDSPLERLQLLGGNDEAIAAFLDEIDVRGPRDREMLRELARTAPLARPERFESDHRRVLVALESCAGTAIMAPAWTRASGSSGRRSATSWSWSPATWSSRT